jgi:hypothetical protein
VVAEVELPVGPASAQSWEKRAAEQAGQDTVRVCGLDTCLDTIPLSGPVRQPMRAAQASVFELDIRIYNEPYIDVCE